MKKVTLESLAKELGVSKVAVYKALNNKGSISSELKQKINALAIERGYRKKSSQDIDHRHFLFAIHKNFFLTSSEQFYTTIYYYLSVELEKNGSSMKIVFLDDEQDNYTALEHVILTSKMAIDGIFIAGEVSKSFVQQLNRVRLPIVFIDFYLPQFEYTFIHQDNYYMSYQITQHLIGMGHTKIGFIGDVQSTSSIADRYYGYKKAMIENKIGSKQEWHINTNIEHLNDVHNLLPSNLPTAFVCHCDSAAHKLYSALLLKGLTIPNDVSVISFDNTTLSEHMIPTLSSIGCNKEIIAKRSFLTMMGLLVDPQKHQNIVLPSVFVQRQSVKNIASK